jgi:glycerophosphoryl diester phosphodiesterase
MRSQVIAHNGGMEGGPAGSIASFADTLHSGCDGVEFDIHRLRDGTLVVSHDPPGPGDQPPALETVLELLGPSMLCNLELKEDGYVKEVLVAARRHLPPERLLVTSAIDAVVATARELDAGLRTGLVIGRLRDPRPTDAEIARRATATGAGYLCVRHSLIEHGVLDTARVLGCPPLVWTVNETGMLRELLADERVGAVITDYPRRAVALRGRRR